MHACSAADCAARQSTAMAHILLLEPRFSFTCGASGDLVLDLNPPDGLSRISQVLMYLDQPAEDIYLDPPPPLCKYEYRTPSQTRFCIYMQELPFPPSTPADALLALHEEYLAPRLDPSVSDVAALGELTPSRF